MITQSEANLLKTGLDMIELYRKNKLTRDHIDEILQTGKIRGWPYYHPTYFVNALIRYSPTLYKEYKNLEGDPEIIKKFLEKAYKYHEERNRLALLLIPNSEESKPSSPVPVKAAVVAAALGTPEKKKEKKKDKKEEKKSKEKTPEELAKEAEKFQKEVNKELEKYKKATGKEIKFHPKSHPTPPPLPPPPTQPTPIVLVTSPIDINRYAPKNPQQPMINVKIPTSEEPHVPLMSPIIHLVPPKSEPSALPLPPRTKKIPIPILNPREKIPSSSPKPINRTQMQSTGERPKPQQPITPTVQNQTPPRANSQSPQQVQEVRYYQRNVITTPPPKNKKFWIFPNKLTGIIVLVGVGIFMLLTVLNPQFTKQLGFFPPYQVTNTADNATNSLVIKKTGPEKVPNPSQGADNALITYHISVLYAGAGSANIEITDRLDERVNFKSADNGGENENGVVKWNINNLSSGQTKTVTLTVAPIIDNIWVVNPGAEGRILSTFGSGGGFCPTPDAISANRTVGRPEACQYFKLGVNIFDTNFSSDSVESYVKAYSPTFIRGQVGDESEFRRRINVIIQKSQQAGLNPVILLGYWKSESVFSTVRTASDLGCAPGEASLKGFDKQVDCALGNIGGGALPAKCARSKDADSDACKQLRGIREATTKRYPDPATGLLFSNADIYKDQPITYPIATLDDFAETYGSRSPLLRVAEGVINNNCIHTYNDLAEVVATTNSCKASPLTGDVDLASCNFTKSDQEDAGNCGAGKSCKKDLPFKSPKLLSYFKEAEAATTVPATLLAGIARIESTTPEYTISDYTDSEITAIENSTQIPDTILTKSNSIGLIDSIKDLRLPGTNKAICPVSSNYALGLMQIQPPGSPSGFDEDSVNAGAVKIGKTVNNLTLKDYCNPKKSILMSAGFIIYKLSHPGSGAQTYENSGKWNSSWTSDKKVISEVARRYYGGLKFGANDEYDYGEDLYKGIDSCKAQAPATAAGFSLTCPLDPINNKKFLISCGSFNNPAKNGCGHGLTSAGYPVCSPAGFQACNPDGSHTDALKKSIDVVVPGVSDSSNQPVYLPFVNGNVTVTWQKVGDLIPVNSGLWGYKQLYQTTYEGKTLTLDITHINRLINNGSSLPSGTQIATLFPSNRDFGGAHLHTAIKVNGKEIEPAADALMCNRYE